MSTNETEASACTGPEWEPVLDPPFALLVPVGEATVDVDVGRAAYY